MFRTFSVILLASTAIAQECALQFDARVSADFVLSDFDQANDVFNPDNVLGAGLAFSELLVLPVAGGSLFDVDTVPVEVTISDDSIFNQQTGFRRAELLADSNSGTDDSTLGIKTLHFSLSQDTDRPLNFSHEYQLVFLEDNAFSTNQFVLKTGTILGINTADPETLQLFGNVNENPPQVLFSTSFTADVFHNFAVVLDFDASTTQVFYSTGIDALEEQTDPIENDLSGQGQFHFGVLKKGTDGVGDITKNGFQEAGIDEGIIFGGIFQEDSADGCISVAP